MSQRAAVVLRARIFYTNARQLAGYSFKILLRWGKKKREKDCENNFARCVCVVHSLEMEAIG